MVIEERCSAYFSVSLLLLLGKLRIALLLAALLGFIHQFVLEFHQAFTVAVAAEVHDFIMMLLGKLVEDVLFHLHAHLLFHLLQFILFVGLSPYNIELATAALSFWVYLISQTGCAQGTTLVEKLWINELGRDGIVRTTCAQHLAFRSAFAVWIAALNHKILDDTVEESAIEISLLCQLQEVVTMLRCLVVEAYLDVAL